MFVVFWQIQEVDMTKLFIKVSSVHVLHGTMSGFLSPIVDSYFFQNVCGVVTSGEAMTGDSDLNPSLTF